MRIYEGDNIRHKTGPISATKSRLLLLGECRRLHRSSPGPTTTAFFNCLNLPTFSQNLAQYRPYTRVRHRIGPLLCLKQVLSARVWARIGCQVHTEVIIPATARDIGNRSPATLLPMLGQCWAVYNFALGNFVISF